MQYCATQLDYVGSLQVVPPSCVPCYYCVGLTLMTARGQSESVDYARSIQPASYNHPILHKG